MFTKMKKFLLLFIIFAISLSPVIPISPVKKKLSTKKKTGKRFKKKKSKKKKRKGARGRKKAKGKPSNRIEVRTPERLVKIQKEPEEAKVLALQKPETESLEVQQLEKEKAETEAVKVRAGKAKVAEETESLKAQLEKAETEAARVRAGKAKATEAERAEGEVKKIREAATRARKEAVLKSSLGKIFGKAISADEFNKTLDEFDKLLQKRIEDAQWLGNKPDATLYKIKEKIPKNMEDPLWEEIVKKFWPFAQRIKVEAGSLIAFWGDIHGDLDSLLTTLQYLRDNSFIDDNLHITNDKLYMIFIGDYVDRGHNSIGVMNTLMKLFIANKDRPDHIVLLRGNHEEISMNINYGFYGELLSTVGIELEKEKKGQEPKIEQFMKLIIKVNNTYNLLPVFVSISVITGEKTEIIAACHGGLELGYDPRPLIGADKAISFQLLGQLKRKTNLNKFELSEPQKAALSKAIPEEKLIDFTPAGLNELGLSWNDFYVDPNTKPMYKVGTRLAWSRDLTNTLLKTWNIQKLFRGHQHNNSSGPMHYMLLKEQGLVKLWPGENKVFTLLTSDPYHESEFASFLLLSVSPWLMQHIIFGHEGKKIEIDK